MMIKVPKHLGQMNRVPVFSALHTCINEFVEIHFMLMTLTKSHHQFVPVLLEIVKSLETYSSRPVELMFTDNVHGNKPELERAIPSLPANVTPVPDSSSLEQITIPATGHSVLVLSSAFQVNTQLSSIMEDIPGNEDAFVASDMKWPVDRVNGIHGHVSLISFTFGQEIFLIPVCFLVIIFL
jgi:hypothetical protein